ncbi:MAG: 50S ribosomal protein L2 [Parcubacteria group bacterium GW2011_GWF2_38_76]|nr:MAG: 50S ribosomal protein L2 [Parcubacteria group bacterium GW2011_GWF2_38_76]HBM45369.1 50S ribosomal protein L2 [Patescibacteria group bacterium]
MKTYRPTTPGRRQLQTVSFDKFLTVSKPHKALTKGFKRDVGRNSAGRVTVNHKGSGHKKVYRMVDFIYDKKNIPAKIETVEYDPFRSSFISLVVFADGEKRYVIVPQNMKVGDTFLISDKGDIKPGNRMMLKNIPVGTFIYNIECKPEGGARLVRSAGNYAEVMSNASGYINVKMPSSEIRKLDERCFACIGTISNEEHNLVSSGKAGRTRWLGIRPTVRGTAKNPCDHPYGGGEGRQGRGTKRPKTRTGKVTGGHKTRKAKKYSNILIVSRRVKKGKKK